MMLLIGYCMTPDTTLRSYTRFYHPKELMGVPTEGCDSSRLLLKCICHGISIPIMEIRIQRCIGLHFFLNFFLNFFLLKQLHIHIERVFPVAMNSG